MTREEAIIRLKEGEPFSEIYDPVWDEALKMAISALSGGEYIKKSELLQHVTTEVLSDYQECDVIHAEEIDKLTTYSFPDSAENKGEITALEAENKTLRIKLENAEDVLRGLKEDLAEARAELRERW